MTDGPSGAAAGLLPATFINAGSVVMTGTSAAFGSVFDNNGTVDIQAGILALNNGGTSTGGTFLVGSGTQLQFQLGSYTIDPTSSVTGTGQVWFLSGITDIDGTFSLTTPGTALVNGGTARFNGTTTVETLLLSFGTLSGTGLVSVTGALDWSGGTMDGAGTTKIEVGAVLSLSGGAKAFVGGRILDNAGDAAWTGGNIEAGAGAKIINQSGATFLVAGAVVYNHSQGGAVPEFDNLGLLDVSPVGSVTFQAVFNNSGSVNLTASTLALTRGGTGTGSVTVAAGTTLQFGGGTHIMGSLTGDGTVDVQSGIAKVTGAYTHAVTGVLQGAGILDLAGGLASAGTVSMTGTLKVGGALAPTGSFSVGTVVFQGVGAVP